MAGRATRGGRLAAAVLAAAALMAHAGPARAAPGDGIQVVGPDGAVTRDLSLLEPPGRTSATLAIVVRLADGAEPATITEFPVVVSGVTAKVDAPLPMALAPGGPGGTAVVSVQDVTDVATFDGFLAAKVGDRQVSLATLHVIKSDATVTIAEAKADGVTAPSNNIDTTLTLHLVNTSNSAIGAVTARVTQLTGASGSITPIVAVAGRQGSPPPPSPLQPGGDLELTITASLPEPGDYTGAITPVVDGRSLAPVSLKVARGTRAPLKLVGVTNGSIALTADDRDSSFVLDVVNISASEVRHVTVRISQLGGPGGRTVSPNASFNGHPAGTEETIGKGAAFPIRIAPDLVAAGDYTGSVSVLLDGVASETAALKITRTTSELPVSLSVKGSFRRRADLFDVRHTDLRVALNAQDTSGRTRDVTVVPQVRRSDASSTEVVTGIKLKLDDDTPACAGKEPDACVHLDALRPTTVRGSLVGVPVPGEYTVTFTFSDQSRTPKTVDAPVFVRRPGWLAALVIFFGVAMSAVVGVLSGVVVKKLRWKRRLSWVNEEMKKVNTTDAELVDSLRQRLVALWERTPKGDDVEADVGSLERQVSLVPDYVRICRLADSGGVPYPPSLVAVRGRLLAASLSDVDQKTAVTELETARKIIDASRTVGPSIDELEAAVDGWRSDASPAATDVDPIVAKVTAARDAVAKGDGALARQSWEDGLQLLSIQLAASLRQAVLFNDDWLADDEGEEAAWTTATTEASTAADAMGGATPATEALRRYLEAANGLVRAKADALARTADRAAQQLDDAKAAAMETVVELGRRARQQAVAGNLGEATQLLDKALVAYRTADPGTKAQASLAGGRLPRLADVRPPAPESSAAVHQPFIPTPRSLARQLLLVQAPLWILTLVVATVIGWQALYVGKPAWGTPLDFFAGVLWGLGLSSATYAGFGSLLTKVSTPAAAP